MSQSLDASALLAEYEGQASGINSQIQTLQGQLVTAQGQASVDLQTFTNLSDAYNIPASTTPEYDQTNQGSQALQAVDAFAPTYQNDLNKVSGLNTQITNYQTSLDFLNSEISGIEKSNPDLIQNTVDQNTNTQVQPQGGIGSFISNNLITIIGGAIATILGGYLLNRMAKKKGKRSK